jgi:hypothetical protein
VLATLTARIDATVIFRKIDVHVISVSPPVKGATITCAGGRDIAVEASIDLDHNPPKVSYGERGSGSRYDNYTVRLNRGDKLDLYITTSTNRKHIVWEGFISMSVNGRQYRFNVNNEGQPLQVTPEIASGRECSWDLETKRWVCR